MNSQSEWNVVLPKRISKDLVSAWIKIHPTDLEAKELRVLLTCKTLDLGSTSGLRKAFTETLNKLLPAMEQAVQGSPETAERKVILIGALRRSFAALIAAGPIPSSMQTKVHAAKLTESGVIPTVATVSDEDDGEGEGINWDGSKTEVAK